VFVQDLVQLSSGELRAATGEGYYVWDKDAVAWKLTSIQYPARILVEDNSGTLWLGLNRDGLIQLDGDKVRHWTDGDILADNEVHSLLVAEDESVWVGTCWGIHRWDGQQWERWVDYDVSGADGPVVGTLYEASDGTIWAETRAGITRWNGKRWHAVPELARCKHLNSILERYGSLWVGCLSGIYRETDAGWQQFGPESGIEDSFGSFLVKGSNGLLYAATRSGLYQYDVSQDEFSPFPID
jgi:ligand-binding sensor domain-containing protein